VGNDFLNEATDAGDGNDASTIVEEGDTLSGAPALPKSFTRGMNVRAAIAWVQATHGENGVRKLADSLPARVVDDLGGASLKPAAMTWVPFLSHSILLEHIDHLFGNGDLKLLLTVGRAMAFHDFPGVARPVARMLSPGFFLDMSTKLWGIYNSHGSWEISRGERELLGVRIGCPENHRAFCAGTCGWIEGALLFCGAVEAEAKEERCAALGAPVCSLRITWKERRDLGRLPRPPT
jgi:hypothetical protein